MKAKLKSTRKRSVTPEAVEVYDFWSRIVWPGLLAIFFVSTPLIFSSGYAPQGWIFCTVYDLPKVCYIAAFVPLFGVFYSIYIYSKNLHLESCTNFIHHNSGIKICFLLLTVMALSLFGSLVVKAGFYHLADYVLLGILGFILAQLFQQNRLRWVAVYALLAGLLLFTILGLIQSTGYQLPFLQPILGAASTFGYRNPAAHFIALVIPFVLFAAGHHYYLWRQSKTGLQLAFCIFFLLLFTAVVGLLFLNYSRAAIMALLAEVLVVPCFWFLSHRKIDKEAAKRPLNWRRLLVVTLFALVVIASLIIIFPKSRLRVERSFKKFHQGGVARLLEARYYHWGNSLMMIKDHPGLGVGLANWPYNYPLYFKSFAYDPLYNYQFQVRRSHNDYLQLAAECGIPALLLFLLLWGRQFYLLRYPSTAEDDGEDWRLPILASLTAFSVIMFFSFPMQMAYSRMFCFFLLALGEARAWPALSK